MNAVISGQAGVAILLDGPLLSSIHAEDLETVVRRRPQEIPYLLGAARDLQFAEDMEIDGVSRQLTMAARQADALHLALILLDPELTMETRRTAAEELEEEMASPEVGDFVVRVLYAHPLPRQSDLVGALSSCTGNTDRVRKMLMVLDRMQIMIAKVYLAWEQIPTSVFGSKEERARALSTAVRAGLFRDLVLILARNESVSRFSARLDGPLSREVLRRWILPLQDRRSASAPDYFFPSAPSSLVREHEVPEPEAQRDGEQASGKGEPSRPEAEPRDG